MKKTIKKSILICMLVGSVMGYSQDENNNEKDIKKAITAMVKGVDTQDSNKIALGFWDDAAIFATRGTEVLTVPVAQFIALHKAKKFGGQDREFEIKNLMINEAGIAHAQVIAQNENIFYEYQLGLTKKEGTWRIQTFLQHAEKK